MVAQSPEPGAHDKTHDCLQYYLPKITIFRGVISQNNERKVQAKTGISRWMGEGGLKPNDSSLSLQGVLIFSGITQHL